MTKAVKEFLLDHGTGEVNVEYSDNTTTSFNLANAVTATQSAQGIPSLDAGGVQISRAYTITEFKRDGESDYTGAFQRAAADGVGVTIPAYGEYHIEDTVVWNGTESGFKAHLEAAPGSKLIAGSGLSGKPMIVLTGTSAGKMVGFALSGYGAELDCGGYATKGIWVKTGARGFVRGWKIKNPTLMGAHCGDPSSPQGGSDIWWIDVHSERDGGANNDPNSIGMYFESHTDIRVINCDPIGFRKGMMNYGVNVDYQNCHPWAKAAHGPMTHGFHVAGSGTRLNMCHGDTPHSRNFDGSIDATITDVYGFFIDAYGGEIAMPRVYLEPTNSVDNVATGIYFNKSDGFYEVSHDRYDTGTGGTNKFKRFIGQLGQTKLRGIRRVGGSAGAQAYDNSNMGDVMPNAADIYGLQTLYNKLKIHQDATAGQALDISLTKSGNGAIINIDPSNTDSAAALLVRLFRNSTTTDPNSGLHVMKGDNTGTGTHALLCRGNARVGLGNNGNYASPHLEIGPYHLWITSAGVLRIKSGAPTSELDGAAVGAQT